MNARSQFGKTIRLDVSRHFDASPEQVFDAWFDPECVGQWLFATPDGLMQRVEIDSRVGGLFRIDELRGKELARHFGEYLEIDRARRLVFSFATDPKDPPSLVTIEIVPENGGCRLTLTHEMDVRWKDYEARARDGWAKILEGLAEMLAASTSV